MSSPFHPMTIDALTHEPDEIVKLIESSSEFKEWGERFKEAEEREDKSFDLERKWVKCQRFIDTAESVALEANLPKFGGKLVQARYEALRKAENGSLGNGHALEHAAN